MKIKSVVGCVLLVWLGISTAKNPPEFNRMISEVKQQAEDNGISESVLRIAFYHVRYLKAVMKHENSQPEFTLTTSEYLHDIVTPEKIKKGRYYYHHYSSHLKKIAKKYGVQPAYLLAIWGVESHYGEYTGAYPVVSSLSTLAYAAKPASRANFFKQELLDELKLVSRGYNQAYQLRSSWAGALGQCQYMPSSFLKYAVSDKGHRYVDIWRNKWDALASIANYLSHYDWNPKEIAAVPVSLSKKFNPAWLNNNKEDHPLKFWLEHGVKTENNVWPVKGSATTWIIKPDKSSKAYLITKNFYRIKHWNDSTSYALAISELAHQIVV